MRVAIAGLHAEPNTFSPVVGDIAVFGPDNVFPGDEIVSRFATSRTTIAGDEAAAGPVKATTMSGGTHGLSSADQPA